MLNATIISIGNELLNGRTINSNATFISNVLYRVGLNTLQVLTVHDDAKQISGGLRAALAVSDIVFVTGGLGPTHDDITKKVVAEYFDSPMVFNESVLQNIETKFRERGLRMPETNRSQGWLPEKARLIDNPVGTAPGMRFESDGKQVFVMPGVPREMKHMMTASVIPFLCQAYLLQPVEVRMYRTTRIPESAIYEKCKEFLAAFSQYEIAFLPKFSGVDIRVAIPPQSDQPGMKESFEALLEEKIGKYIYSKTDDSLEVVVGKGLKSRGLTLAVAESCSGGLIQHMITSVAGSSEYFLGGLVTYSNESKTTLLGVQETSLAVSGAVSDTVAREMASGARDLLGSDLALSTTGIAGPGGGTVEKPVGLVYVGLATPEGVMDKQFRLGSDRAINQEQAAVFALDMLRRWLTGFAL